MALEGKNNPHYFIPQGKPGISSLLFLLSPAQIAENSRRRGKVKRRNDPKMTTRKKMVHANHRIINLAMQKYYLTISL